LLIQTIYGARDIDPLQLETARSFRIRRRDRILRVTLMGAVPYIATGLRIASATALVLAIIAEVIIGSEGLGWALNSLFAVAERRVLHWHPSHRKDVA
jgi:ABC-type nitrate/sulfonate/bicarbonate transport system permease component